MKIKTVNSAQTPPIAKSKSRIVKFCIMVIPKLLILKGFLLIGAKVNPLPQDYAKNRGLVKKDFDLSHHIHKSRL